MLVEIGWFVVGLVLIALGADSLVRALAGFALRGGAGAFAVGLVAVGFGASLPELSVSASALVQGAPQLALGNVVGSNIANVGLVLAGAALAAPLVVSMAWLRVALPALIAAPLLLIGLGWDGTYGRIDGIVLLVAFAALFLHASRASRAEPAPVQAELATAAATQSDPLRNLLRLALGLVALWYGADFAVDAAREIAVRAGWSELVAGLTLVAVCNALPELAAAVFAARRGYGNLVVAAVVGTSLVNALLVVGAGAAWADLPVARSLLHVELPAMFAFALVLYPMVRGDSVVSRREAAVLLAAFVGLVAWQLWRATTLVT